MWREHGKAPRGEVARLGRWAARSHGALQAAVVPKVLTNDARRTDADDEKKCHSEGHGIDNPDERSRQRHGE